MQYHSMKISSLLALPPTGTTHIHPVALAWDIRHNPRHAARVDGQLITPQQLARLAIKPGVTSVHVISDLFSEDWVITANNPAGVTVEDVLLAIHRTLHAPLTQIEWGCIPPTQRSRIEETFYQRCGASRDFDRTRQRGVRRMDCLLHTTMFAGLSSLMFRNSRWEVVLTISRDFGAHVRARGQ